MLTIAAITVLILAVYAGSSFSLAKGQPNTPLPVILIHGYKQDKSIWSIWESLLESKHIPYRSVTFNQSDDDCGLARDHASELNTLVQDILLETGHQKVNIVGYSKGGLDARVYLDNSNTDDVANLIMIATPNEGSILADYNYLTDWCKPAVHDLRTGSEATQADINTNTEYHTISGDVGTICTPIWGGWGGCFMTEGNGFVPGPDDWVVAVSSVESEDYNNLGRTSHVHGDPPGQMEYNLAEHILTGQR